MHFFSSASLFLAAVPLVMGAQQVELYRDESYSGHKQVVPADHACHVLDGALQRHVGSIRIPTSDVECEVYGDAACTHYLTEVYPPGEPHFTQPYGLDAVGVICGVDMQV